MDITTIILTVVGGLLGGGLIAFIQFLITRHDNKHDKFKGITDAINDLSEKAKTRFNTLDEKIDMVESKGDERFAISARVRILRFEDELQEGRKHSKDSWDQVMSDIDFYVNYTEPGKHPEFKNHQTQATIEHIKHGYADRLEKRDFTY